MGSEIITLNCPKCGSSDQVIDLEMQFGFEFECKHCGSTSVLVYNNRLYMPLPGEKVCNTCGRVAQRNARFCQCGKSLVKKCINQNCLLEIPVDHNICDFCGWRQDIDPISPEGDRVSLHLSIKKYLDPEKSVMEKGREVIEGLILTSRDKHFISTILEELAANGIDITPHVVQIAYLLDDNEIQEMAVETFEKYEQIDRSKIHEFPDSQACINEGVLAAIKYTIENHGLDTRMDFIGVFDNLFSRPLEQSILKKISIEASDWIPDLVSVINNSKNYQVKNHCKQILVYRGSSCIPVLEKCKRNKELSLGTIEWINHAIDEILGKKYT